MSLRLRALLVEDSDDDAQLLLHELRRAGYDASYERVETAAAMQEALARKHWDIVLSDYRMPQFNGLAALEILKKSGLDLPFIIVSGTIGEDVAVAAMKAGAHDYLIKGKLARLGPAIDRELRDAKGRQEQRLAEESVVRLMHAVSTSGEVVFMTDREGVITFINPEFTRLYGYTEAEVVGQVTPRILKSGGTQGEEYGVFWRRILEKQVVRGEIINKTKAGRLVTVESSANPIIDQHGNVTGFLAIQRDITERKRLEQQFLQSQKMEAVGRLAGGVAHDFNNLLTIINGYSQLILERPDLDDVVQNQMKEILKSGERAASLTQQLLAFSRKQVIEPRVLDLNTVLGNMDKMLRRLIGEDVELATNPGAQLGRVKADPTQIEQVIMNLVVNARDAMPRGGKLTIETKNAELDESYTSTHVDVMPGHYVMLAISDSGHGMDAETMAHIFEPFFTTKELGKGTGLGLSTVYGIVKQTGGHVSVYSEVGRGTTFKVYLPRLDMPVEPAGVSVERGDDVSGQETILVVEDEAGVRMLIQSILERQGYTVLLASTPDDAAALSEKHAGRIHLLLTDVVMPGFSGKELADHLAFARPDMKVLFISGYTADAIAHQGVLDAETQFLQKPFTPNALLRKVRETIEKRIP